MTKPPRKLEPPLFLDMDFGEALTRFGRTDPEEVRELERKKKAAEVDNPGGENESDDDESNAS